MHHQKDQKIAYVLWFFLASSVSIGIIFRKIKLLL